MRKAVIAAGWLLAMASTALAQQNQGQAPGQGTGGPQPNKQQPQNGGLFSRNEPVPMYSTSNNNATASLQAPGGTSSPNAGATGLTGSGSQSYGWAAPAYGPPPGQR